MEINKKKQEYEFLEMPKSLLVHSPKEVVVVKEVFPQGATGRMLLNSKYQIIKIESQVACKIGYPNAGDIIGQLFANLFVSREKVRLNYFLKNTNQEYLSILSYLQLKKNNVGLNWINVYCKKENLDDGQCGYSVVFLDEEGSFARVTKDRFEKLYHLFFDMYESELAQIGLNLRDDIAQELYALRVSLQKFILTKGYEEEITDLKQRLNETIRKVYNLSNDLLPIVLVQMGFLPAIEDMVFSVQKLGINLRYKIDPSITGKSKEFQFCCYRVIQTLFLSWKQNVLPHEVSLSITARGNKVNIKLNEYRSPDNTSRHNYQEAILLNVRNRIAMYDGALEVGRVLDNSQVRITMYN